MIFCCGMFSSVFVPQHLAPLDAPVEVVCHLPVFGNELTAALSPLQGVPDNRVQLVCHTVIDRQLPRARTASTARAPSASPQSIRLPSVDLDNKNRSNPPTPLSSKPPFYTSVERAEREKAELLGKIVKVHKKQTFASRVKRRQSRRALNLELEEEIHIPEENEYARSDPSRAFTVAKTCHTNKQSVRNFINERKEIFRLQYAITVKQGTIEELERTALQKEKEFRVAEEKLKEDAIAFEEFLKANDGSSANAAKIVAQEKKSKEQAAGELKSALNELRVVQRQIAEAEVCLNDYLYYEAFLMKLSPKEWQDEQNAKKKKARVEKLHKPQCGPLPSKKLSGSNLALPEFQSILTNRKMSSPRYDNEKNFTDYECFLDDLNCDMEPEIYFSDPKQLLEIFTDLEEQNLALIRDTEDLAEIRDDIKQTTKSIKLKIDEKVNILLAQKETLEAACLREEEKSAELALRAKMFSFGEFNPEVQDKTLHMLRKKIEEVYRVSSGEMETTHISAIEMLRQIENRVEELCDIIETIPKETIEAIEKTKRKERRQRLREEKAKEAKKIQEERLKCSLQRAIAEPKKKVGRPLVYRSKPPDLKKDAGRQNIITKTQEDAWFFI
ncbi:coiled-coil domain-containing protein 38 isoform X1 [Alligator mississippiensis]|uniref:coiled-coil domain-containing protein 38 isoform X1 n=1 Tax=Alligator mississippiensis TaxID=8496 RepID=UPI002878080C|nr:coiled-coil domain-containing protein 38 isoform X1 [Alligator mississippiensis]